MASATIIDVARRAGVSVKTVSRVVNAEPHVRQELRERVAAAIKDLRYRPKISARSMRGSRSYVVGYLLYDPSVAYASRAQMGALSACRRSGYHLVVEAVDLEATDLPAELEPLFSTLDVDGVLLIPPYCDNTALLDFLDERGVPYARMAPGVQPDRSPRVEADDRRAAHEMTLHLTGLGHRRIGIITGAEGHTATHERLEGYRQALAEQGLPFDESLVVRGDFRFEPAYAAAEKLLALQPRPTAVFACNDAMAAAVMAVAWKAGLKLPDDLSVAGFDDIATAGMLSPPLTTVRQPIAEMAAAATEMLIAGAARNPDENRPAHEVMHCELVIRASTAPPPKA